MNLLDQRLVRRYRSLHGEHSQIIIGDDDGEGCQRSSSIARVLAARGRTPRRSSSSLSLSPLTTGCPWNALDASGAEQRPSRTAVLDVVPFSQMMCIKVGRASLRVVTIVVVVELRRWGGLV